jgi:hypothetical protein
MSLDSMDTGNSEIESHGAGHDTPTAFSAERELPVGLSMNRWAKAVWFRKHSSGAVCVGWHLFPSPIYVVGWSSWAGFKVIPKVRDGFVEADPGKAEARLDALCKRVFAAGPTEAMIEEAERIRAKYAANGALGGRRRKVAQERKPSKADAPTGNPAAISKESWSDAYPGWGFDISQGRLIVTSPSKSGVTARTDVYMLVEKFGAAQFAGKDLAWCEKHGPTPELAEAIVKYRRSLFGCDDV